MTPKPLRRPVLLMDTQDVPSFCAEQGWRMRGPLQDVVASHSEQRHLVQGQGAIADQDAWYRLVICGRPEQVCVARAFVRQVLGYGHPGTERVTLLTSELVTNSVNHSNSRREGGSITVTVRTSADCVRVEVRDDGGPTAPTLCCEGDLAEDLAEAGRGLRLVEAYSLMWDHYQHGTGRVTWFECVPEPLPLTGMRVRER
jgi:anti-sigma regulatory factor (Ser/Thr protein kinase)